MRTASPRSGEIVIAIDARDAENFRIKRNSKDLRLLYEDVPMTREQLINAFFDPAMLPFIAQSVMRIMAEEDKGRYTYYQRRLAEFQSKIESTIDIGKHLLGSTKMLDITGAEGTWIRSSITGGKAPASVWERWKAGTAAVKAALDEAQRRNWLILLDPWTPEIIRAVATGYEYRMTLPPLSKTRTTSFFSMTFSLRYGTKPKTLRPNDDLGCKICLYVH